MDIVNQLGKFSGKSIKGGKNIIKGFNVDIEDYTDKFITMSIIPPQGPQELGNLFMELYKAGFNVKKNSKTSLTITPSETKKRIK